MYLFIFLFIYFYYLFVFVYLFIFFATYVCLRRNLWVHFATFATLQLLAISCMSVWQELQSAVVRQAKVISSRRTSQYFRWGSSKVSRSCSHNIYFPTQIYVFWKFCEFSEDERNISWAVYNVAYYTFLSALQFKLSELLLATLCSQRNTDYLNYPNSSESASPY